MDDDTSLMASLDGIPLEQTSRAAPELVEVQTVLALYAALAAPLETRVLDPGIVYNKGSDGNVACKGRNGMCVETYLAEPPCIAMACQPTVHLVLYEAHLHPSVLLSSAGMTSGRFGSHPMCS